MLHRITDYTSQDLERALASPYLTEYREFQLEAERLRRKQRDKDETQNI